MSECYRRAITAIGLITAAALLFCSCGPSLPGRGSHSRSPGDGFIRLFDTDRDGSVSREEYLAAFDRLDRDGSGYIESTEAPTPRNPRLR